MKTLCIFWQGAFDSSKESKRSVFYLKSLALLSIITNFFLFFCNSIITNFKVIFVILIHLKYTISSRRKRAMIDDLYDHAKVNSPVIERAEEVRANLAPSNPSFWKAMVKSNVSHGFWLVSLIIFCPKFTNAIIPSALE